MLYTSTCQEIFFSIKCRFRHLWMVEKTRMDNRLREIKGNHQREKGRAFLSQHSQCLKAIVDNKKRYLPIG